MRGGCSSGMKPKKEPIRNPKKVEVEREGSRVNFTSKSSVQGLGKKKKLREKEGHWEKKKKPCFQEKKDEERNTTKNLTRSRDQGGAEGTGTNIQNGGSQTPKKAGEGRGSIGQLGTGGGITTKTSNSKAQKKQQDRERNNGKGKPETKSKKPKGRS